MAAPYTDDEFLEALEEVVSEHNSEVVEMCDATWPIGSERWNKEVISMFQRMVEAAQNKATEQSAANRIELAEMAQNTAKLNINQRNVL